MNGFNDWCITRSMSWEAVRYLCSTYQISFDELPVAGDNFWRELNQVRRDITEKERKLILEK